VCFSEQHRQAIYIAYELTREQLNNPVVKRAEDFREDDEFKSAGTYDFSNTIYERGHLAPAADMKWSAQAMADSFSMANITPQKKAMNHGRWLELEDMVRNWARKYGEVYIVMGPLLDDSLTKVGRSQVSLPKAHFKCVLEMTIQPEKSVCFVIPQDPNLTLADYTRTVDQVEALTGLDLFAALNDEIETRIEATNSFSDWMKGYNMKAASPAYFPAGGSSGDDSSRSPAPRKSAPRANSAAQSAPAAPGTFTCAPKYCSQLMRAEILLAAHLMRRSKVPLKSMRPQTPRQRRRRHPLRSPLSLTSAVPLSSALR
ncbi:MAG: DNA/RNA non-specific endonuclease, partial [Proteobacteria bacterium]